MGGAYGDIILALPYELSTESFLENGCFDDIDSARKHAKYIISKFVRALIFVRKYGPHTSRDFWKSVPVQDYTEDFWNTDDIDKIDEGLFDKYNVPENIRDFVKKNIYPMSIKNILGYDGKDIDFSKVKEEEMEEPEVENPESSDPDKPNSECTSKELEEKYPNLYRYYEKEREGHSEFLGFKTWLERKHPYLFGEGED